MEKGRQKNEEKKKRKLRSIYISGSYSIVYFFTVHTTRGEPEGGEATLDREELQALQEDLSGSAL